MMPQMLNYDVTRTTTLVTKEKTVLAEEVITTKEGVAIITKEEEAIIIEGEATMEIHHLAGHITVEVIMAVVIPKEVCKIMMRFNILFCL